MEEVFESSKESLVGSDKEESPAPTTDEEAEPAALPNSNREVFSKFRAIITDYLNGDVVDTPDAVTQNVLSSYSLAGYLDYAVPTGKEIIITKLLQQCCFLLQELLRVSDGICYTHEEPATAIIHLIQMQLLNHYPKYSTQGYEALYSCPPTIYISPLCIPSLGNVICKRLGFPSSCVKVMKMTGRALPKLEKSLQEDLAAKRVPLMIIASSGSHHSGQVDNLVAVSQLSQRFNTWLHLEGHLITHLSLSTEKPKKSLQVADSLHLDLRQLLGIPSLPYVTMYRHCEIALQRAACLTPSNCSPFSVVPLWFALQSFETADICKRFQTAVDLSRQLVNHLVTIPNIKMMSHVPKMIKSASFESSKSPEVEDIPTIPIAQPVSEPTADQETANAVEVEDSSSKVEEETAANVDEAEVAEEKDEVTDASDSFTEAITVGQNEADDDEEAEIDEERETRTKPEVLMDGVAPVVVFQYRPRVKENEQCPASLLDDLNLWLVQVLERSCEEIHLDIIDVDESGYALRFCPYDCKSFPSTDSVEHFIASLDMQLEILNATVMHKSTLVQIVDSSEELQLVELPGWAGLGGVRYLPAAWRASNMEQLPDQGKEEINKINRDLVAKLKLTDSAFSIGEGRDGLACVRFGMVVAVTDVTALANLVRQTGLDLEASTLALETMAVMIRKGIEEAQAELQKETEEKLWQEGLLRHIPVVGSLVNYFSPPPSMPIKGRTLNLESGRIEKSQVLLHPVAQGMAAEVASTSEEDARLPSTDDVNQVAGNPEVIQEESIPLTVV